MIKINQMIHFNTLIKQLNFRKAARIHNITHPAFSRSIANLEATLGVKLFHRHPSGVSATIYSQTVEKYAKQILSAIHELEREIKLIKDGGIGELSIALGPYPAEFSGHRAIGKLINDSPDIRCKVLVSSWEDVEKMVMDRQVDLGMAELTQAVNNIYLKTEPLANHQGVIFCRTSHPILAKKRVSKKDLESYPFVLTKIPSRAVPYIPGKLFKERGSDHAFPSIQIEEIALSRQIIEESDALGIATPLQIQTELENNVFSVVPYKTENLFTNYGFMYLRDRELSPVAIKFMNFVRELEADINTRNMELVKHYL